MRVQRSRTSSTPYLSHPDVGLRAFNPKALKATMVHLRADARPEVHGQQHALAALQLQGARPPLAEGRRRERLAHREGLALGGRPHGLDVGRRLRRKELGFSGRTGRACTRMRRQQGARRLGTVCATSGNHM